MPPRPGYSDAHIRAMVSIFFCFSVASDLITVPSIAALFIKPHALSIARNCSQLMLPGWSRLAHQF
ncbi:hypothetical protein B0H12DRAFT_470946 [Mycena haematopus]|nr:hypothetical protein B0H12DRAFT_470946 [Mycena haematopus]